jgi:hypothetical protein
LKIGPIALTECWREPRGEREPTGDRDEFQLTFQHQFASRDIGAVEVATSGSTGIEFIGIGEEAS